MSKSTLEIRPLVEIIDGSVRTTSQSVSARFNKVHRDVVRAIELLDCSSEFRVRNFAQSSADVRMPRGGVRKVPAYTMTRDGFTFLAMGFTGKQAAKFKEDYINAFNQMEAQLKKPEPLGAFIHMHQGMQSLAGQRYLISFNETGTGYGATPVANDCCVMSPREFIKALGDPNGFFFDNQMLIDLLDVVSARVRSRLTYGAYQKQEAIDVRQRGNRL